MFVTQIFANAMVKHNVNDGCVVNISSISATTTHPGLAAYGMSKAALINFTKTAALEYGKYGIRCNAVAPASIKTAMVKNMSIQEEVKICQMTALGKLGRPEGKLCIVYRTL